MELNYQTNRTISYGWARTISYGWASSKELITCKGMTHYFRVDIDNSIMVIWK